MKNFILGLLALLLCAVSIPAEVIDSVMYNPARLGQYEKLKVSDKASFKGGVKANTLTLQSAGTVSISNAGDYQVSNADVKGSVNIPSTHFVAPTIKAQGGTTRFVQTGETSSIDTINSVLPRLKANILKMNAVTVNGSSSTDYDRNSIKGLRLGGNDIPAPDTSCSGLEWFARIDQNSGQTYQVLGLGACEGGEETEHTCPDSGLRKDERTYWNASARRCECPNAGEYFHMGACCSSSTPKSNIYCWSQNSGHKWTETVKYRADVMSSNTPQECEVVNGRYDNLRSITAIAAGHDACSSIGARVNASCPDTLPAGVCVHSCSVQQNGLPTGSGKTSYTIYASLLVCEPSANGYTPKWDTSKDTRYSCGH